VGISLSRESASYLPKFVFRDDFICSEPCSDPSHHTNILRTCTQHRAKPVSVRNEDDILHLTNEELPTFGGVLSPADSERFLQFFTVPYLRIPLILDFFANGDPGKSRRHLYLSKVWLYNCSSYRTFRSSCGIKD
jgi:hypothetical protein